MSPHFGSPPGTCEQSANRKLHHRSPPSNAIEVCAKRATSPRWFPLAVSMADHAFLVRLATSRSADVRLSWTRRGGEMTPYRWVQAALPIGLADVGSSNRPSRNESPIRTPFVVDHLAHVNLREAQLNGHPPVLCMNQALRPSTRHCDSPAFIRRFDLVLQHHSAELFLNAKAEPR